MKKIIASVMLACFGASILIAEVPAAVAASDPFAGVEGVELSAVEEGEVEGGLGPVGGAIMGAGVDFTVQMIINKGDIKKTDVGSIAVSAVLGAMTSGVSALAAKTAKTVYVTSFVNTAKSDKIIITTGEVVANGINALSASAKKDVTTTTTTVSGGVKTVTTTTVSKPWWSWKK